MYTHCIIISYLMRGPRSDSSPPRSWQAAPCAKVLDELCTLYSFIYVLYIVMDSLCYIYMYI